MVNLFEHQKEALLATDNADHVAYYMDMGLGKTFVGSEKARLLMTDHTLVICQATKVDDWIDHFTENYDYPVYNLRKKKERDEFSKASDLRIGVINYDTIWSANRLGPYKNYKWDTVILDESQALANSKSKRTKFILSLNFKHVILLSGTPTSGKYENLWSQYNLLGGKDNEWKFNHRFCNYRKITVDGSKANWGSPRQIEIINKDHPYKNFDALQKELEDRHCYFRKTEECIDLPDQIVTDVWVDPPKEYTKFLRDKVVEVGDGIEIIGDTTLTTRLGLKQLASTYNKNKYDAVSDIIESTNDRLIIFYNYNAEFYRLKDIIKKPLSYVNGQGMDLDAYKNESNSITLCQYQSGSTGLNLQLASRILYFAPTDSCAHLMQSMKRIHRIGQDKTCFYYRLQARGTIDADIYRALDNGVDYTNALFEQGVSK